MPQKKRQSKVGKRKNDDKPLIKNFELLPRHEFEQIIGRYFQARRGTSGTISLLKYLYEVTKTKMTVGHDVENVIRHLWKTEHDKAEDLSDDKEKTKQKNKLINRLDTHVRRTDAQFVKENIHGQLLIKKAGDQLIFIPAKHKDSLKNLREQLDEEED